MSKKNRKCKIIAVANQKGGVGKTTSCVNLAASLQAAKRKVLVIDLDPQGNATMGCGINKHDVELSINDLMLNRARLDEVIVNTKAGFDVLPANRDLTEAEISLVHVDNNQVIMRDLLRDRGLDYDFILIDCPPTLNMLTLNALVAAHSVFIPMQCEYFALEGLASLVETIEQIKSTLNPDLIIEGLLRTMYDSRNKLSTEVSKQLIRHFGKKVFQTIIPRNVRLAEAPSHGLPALLYDKRSQGATAYLVLAGELLRKQRNYKKAKAEV